MTLPQDLCLILDFGSPYTQLIARHIRDCKVYSEIRPFDVDIERIRSLSPQAIVLGDSSLLPSGALSVAPEVYQLGVPVLEMSDGDWLQQGGDILPDFLFRVAGFPPNWTMSAFLDSAVRQIRSEVADGRVVLGLSGGVDSWVTAALMERAVHDQLFCISIDNGFLRRGERAGVESVFSDMFHAELRVIDAAERFLAAVAGAGQGKKRKRIQNEFIAVFEEEATRIGRVGFLARGIIYSDVIDSIVYDGTWVTIAKPYDVADPGRSLGLRVLEPLRRLFKNEVRELGGLLGLPAEILRRHPFPFPGLAVRCVGEVTPARLATLREADAIIEEEIRSAGLYESLWQSFGVLLREDSYSRGGRHEAVCLRAVESEDGGTADWAPIPHEVLRTISLRIMNEVPNVGRVVYDITPKPPGRVEWE